MPAENSPSLGDPLATSNVPTLDSEKPWLARKDWASGELSYHANVLPGILPAFLGSAVLSLAFGLASELPSSIRAHGSLALIPILISGALGLLFTVQGVRLMIGGLKTGQVRFRLEGTPIPLGGPLRGLIQMSKPILAGRPVRLRLQCIRWTAVRGRPNQDIISYQTVLSALEHTVISDGTGAIPVSLMTTAAAPPTQAQPKGWPSHDATARKTWVEWRFTVEDPTGKVGDRHADFELPVFRVAGIPEVTVTAAAPDLESIRAVRTVEMNSYRPGRDFRVRITQLREGGTEFYFPPVRGHANAGGQTAVALIMAAILFAVSGPVFSDLGSGTLLGNFFELALYVGWAILTLLLLLWVMRLWFAPEWLTIADGVLSDTVGLFAKTRIMPVAEISGIYAVRGAYTKYNAIRIVGARWHALMVGDGIRERQDAEWLAMQISRAAGVRPSASLPGEELGEELRRMQTFIADIGAIRGRRTPPGSS